MTAAQITQTSCWEHDFVFERKATKPNMESFLQDKVIWFIMLVEMYAFN